MQTRTQGRTYPESVTSEMAFGRCLIEGNPQEVSPDRGARRKAFGASLAIEVTLLALLIISPLLSSVAGLQFRRVPPQPLMFLGARSHHDPIQQVAARTEHASTIANPFPPDAPVSLSRFAAPEEVSAPDLPDGYVTGTIELPEIGSSTPPLVEPPHIIAPPSQPDRRPVKLSEGVLQAQLISRIEPQYPALAMQTKTQGTVILRAIINREGRITSLTVLSGHPLLVQAALAAVREWRYRPTMLNGEPVEVETSITVIFRLLE